MNPVFQGASSFERVENTRLAAYARDFLLKAVPPSEFKVRLVQPVLAAAADAKPLPANSTPTSMDTSTLLSIGLFACLQVAMYFICLMKIREIERSAHPTPVKLRLMENEENLFDGGLYIGIAGTAITNGFKDKPCFIKKLIPIQNFFFVPW